MRFDEVRERLRLGLAGPLPGPEAQRKLAPIPPRGWPQGYDPSRLRHAAGLLLVYPVDTRGYLLLTLRAGTLGRHGGQVSLPGGVVEPGESIERAALREAQEETGLAADLVHTLAPLTPVDIPVSGFRLHPIVGVAEDRPALVPAADEVARVLEVPIAELLAPDRVTWQTVVRDGHVVRAPGFAILDAHLWGATAMVIAEFLTLLGWAGPDRDPYDAA